MARSIRRETAALPPSAQALVFGAVADALQANAHAGVAFLREVARVAEAAPRYTAAAARRRARARAAMGHRAVDMADAESARARQWRGASAVKDAPALGSHERRSAAAAGPQTPTTTPLGHPQHRPFTERAILQAAKAGAWRVELLLSGLLRSRS